PLARGRDGVSARGRRPRERAVDDATRRAVEADLRRYREYQAEMHRAELHAALAAGYARPAPEGARVNGYIPDPSLATLAQYRRLLAADESYQRARRVVAAIEAAYMRLDGVRRRIVEELYWDGRPAAQVAAAWPMDESTLRAHRREIVRVTLMEFRRRGVPTYAEGESA
ncbi:MAG: hypothetical protein QJR03_12120, partial [Sphaerobacter sp.]|nr:hypothetical protein [Sphaerobacter sp.]